MTSEGMKDAAEAVLRELPSVIGAFVREDVYGHPREVHLLIRSGPNPRNLAYDIRDLLEERLGVPIDQRIISIAQLAAGRRPGPILASRAGFEPEPEPEPSRPAEPAASEPEAAPPPDRRLRFEGISIEAMDNRLRVEVTLGHEDALLRGEAYGLNTPPARQRAVAAAALQAANLTCVGRARFEVEHTATIAAFDRAYVLVSVMASSPFLGRRPIPLAGAQLLEADAESAAALAALKAVNRTLALVLRLPDTAAARLPRSLRLRR
jgi:hypothetical protein